MDIVEVIKNRRSIRAFMARDVSKEDVWRLVNAARWAPSAGNVQPWESIIVRNLETKKMLVAAALGQSFIEEAPVLIVVCANENASSRRYGARGKTLYCIRDTAAAAQNIHLAACSFGLGTCWAGAFEEDEVRKVLSIPSGVRPVALIPVGYVAEEPAARARKPLNGIIHDEFY